VTADGRQEPQPAAAARQRTERSSPPHRARVRACPHSRSAGNHRNACLLHTAVNFGTRTPRKREHANNGRPSAQCNAHGDAARSPAISPVTCVLVLEGRAVPRPPSPGIDGHASGGAGQNEGQHVGNLFRCSPWLRQVRRRLLQRKPPGAPATSRTLKALRRPSLSRGVDGNMHAPLTVAAAWPCCSRGAHQARPHRAGRR
jgi:hypothetical protein